MAVGQKMDLMFSLLRLDLIHSDYTAVKANLAKARKLFEEGGDWERKNRLKVHLKREPCRGGGADRQGRSRSRHHRTHELGRRAPAGLTKKTSQQPCHSPSLSPLHTAGVRGALLHVHSRLQQGGGALPGFDRHVHVLRALQLPDLHLLHVRHVRGGARPRHA